MMRKVNNIIRLGFAMALVLSAVCCGRKNPNAERSDFIRVYENRDSDLPLDRTWVSVKGGTYTYYIRSTVDFSATWQSEDLSWAKLGELRKLEDGLWSIDLTVEPLSKRSVSQVGGNPLGVCTRRYGVIMLSRPELFLGKYLVVDQGFENRIANDFSWLHGSANPNDVYSDVLMSKWTASQKGQGFTSTVMDGSEDAWVYSKEGYVKLGNDEGAGADLITPRNSDFQYDTLLVVSFKAVAQTGETLPDYSGGTEPIVPMDASRRHRTEAAGEGGAFRVEVNGGGYIRDLVETKGTSLSLNLSSYNRESASFPSDIFDGQSYLVFIEGTDTNPITVNTAVRFVADKRTFIDDIFIYRLDQLLDEDFFSLNGGKSGRDLIMGGTGNE